MSDAQGKSVWIAPDVLAQINLKSVGEERINDTLRRLLEVPEKFWPQRPVSIPKPTDGKRGGRFKYDVTDLSVGESRTFTNVNPELVVPCINRYGRTRGKHFMCQGAPGQVTVTRMR